MKIEKIPSGEALHRPLVLFIILHHFVVAGNTLNGNIAEDPVGKVAELFGKIFADVPRVSRERKTAIGRG